MMQKTARNIRNNLLDKFNNQDFVTDKTGVKTVEILAQSFIADGPIFREPNLDYVERELEWYESCSLYVQDIPGKTPSIWNQVSSKDGKINSNYGYLVYHPDNGYQYDRVKEELIANPFSRRAIMIYTRPTMHMEYNCDGMSDFICTNTVQYVIRNDKLHAMVNMRSNDVVFGYLNDLAWQKTILDKLSRDLEIESGDIHWCAGSLHVYEKDFYLLDHYGKTGEWNITKSKYKEIYHEKDWI